MNKIKQYVLGFVFNTSMTEVVLMRKNRPIEQQGKLNGVGGKVEDGESSMEAMIRECQEETTLNIDLWKMIGSINDQAVDNTFNVDVYMAVVGNISEASTTTDEEVSVIPVSRLGEYELVDNIMDIINRCVSLPR